MMMKLAKSLVHSPALRAAAVMGGSGLALACGNLMLARVLAPEEFARFVLIYALMQIGINVGPIGADVILTRDHFDPGPRIHRQVLLTSCAVACVVSALSSIFYGIGPLLNAALWVSIATGGIRTVAIAHYRSQQRFNTALLFTVSTNVALLLASGVALFIRANTARLPAIVMALSLSVVALIGWRSVVADKARTERPRGAMRRYPWRAGWSAVSFTGAGMVLAALERLITPQLLGLATMATFSVLATVAGSPFTILYQGIGYTLLPGLRNAKDQAQRRKVLSHEGKVAAIICTLAGIATWWLTPIVVRYALAGRYHIDSMLLLVTILSGVLKVASSLPAAAVSALGSTADLARLSWIGWASIAVGLGAAAVGAHWGLAGLVAGVALGWLLRTVAAAWLVLPHLLSTPATAGLPVRDANP
jgi:O-antigen/teichoic acid export membrane protein